MPEQTIAGLLRRIEREPFPGISMECKRVLTAFLKLREGRKPTTVRAIAAETDVAYSTVNHHLNKLIEIGYLRRDENRVLVLGEMTRAVA